MNAQPHEAVEHSPFLDCVHCGFCLPACPTFTVLGTEMDSPRGRIQLMRAKSEGKIAELDTYRKHIELCLVCRACETACPSGVQFGEMMEAARAELQIEQPRPIRKAMLGMLLRPRLLSAMAGIARVLQRTGIVEFYDRVGAPRALSPGVLPRIPPASVRKSYSLEIIPAAGPRRHRVGFLRGCVADVLFSGANRATIDVLCANGCEVVMPAGQTCCGALHVHNGLRDEARTLARKNIDAFAVAGVDAIVTNAAGCGSTMKEYGKLLADDDGYSQQAATFGGRVRDVSEFLAAIPRRSYAHELSATVAYHDACHLAHGQGIREAPRNLLKEIPGLHLVELNDDEMCCGSAGIYNVVHPDIAQSLLDRKIDHIRDTGATILAASNPGCVMQIAAGVRRAGLHVRVVHPIELLAEAL